LYGYDLNSQDKGAAVSERVTVTIELDAESVAAAEAAKIGLSRLLTDALRRHLPYLHAAERAEADRKWREENRKAIEAHNKLIEEHGLFSDGVRMF
jgi:antitoxin CcdA